MSDGKKLRRRNEPRLDVNEDLRYIILLLGVDLIELRCRNIHIRGGQVGGLLPSDLRRNCHANTSSIRWKLLHRLQRQARPHRVRSQRLPSFASMLAEKFSQQQNLHYSRELLHKAAFSALYSQVRSRLSRVFPVLGVVKPASFMQKIFRRFHAETDEAGNFFIDRSGDKFQHVLEFLRTGSLESGVDLNSILQEAQFYLLDDLISYIERRQSVEAAAKASPAAPAVRLDGIYRSEDLAKCYAFIDDHRFVSAGGANAVSNIIGFLLGGPLPDKWKQTRLDEAFASFCANNVSRGTYWLEKENKLTLLVDNSKYVAAVAAGESIHILSSGVFHQYTFHHNNQLSKFNLKPEEIEGDQE